MWLQLLRNYSTSQARITSQRPKVRQQTKYCIYAFIFLFSCFEDKSRIQRDDKSENMSLHSCGFNEISLTIIHSLKYHLVHYLSIKILLSLPQRPAREMASMRTRGTRDKEGEGEGRVGEDRAGQRPRSWACSLDDQWCQRLGPLSLSSQIDRDILIIK